MDIFRPSDPITPIRGVHLDLKGCPPTAERLVSLLKVISAAGYNAVLVEWEDQFPWTVDKRFRNETAYAPDQVKAFAEAAHHLGIEIIPLVQCLGHMETPLSIPDYAKLREVPDRPDVLNPLAPGARELVEKMQEDVLALLPDVKHFHLGGDEAWTFGTHPDTKAFIEKNGKGALYLHHVEPLLDKLNAKNIRPILWHDMMLHWEEPALKKLSTKADLMVWGYGGKVMETKGHHSAASFEKLKSAGIPLWGACAYKGAEGPDADLPNWNGRETNALGYAEVADRFKLQGIVATAWSRYNTHLPQCEPIDAALDIMVDVGVVLHDGQPPEGGRDTCLKLLETVGERERFEKCFKSMESLINLRTRGWDMVRDLREQFTMQAMDPRRAIGQTAERNLEVLRNIVAQGDELTRATKSTYAGLMPDLWTERYLGERLNPLRDEFKELTAKMK
jgi:hexosaminidase